MGRRGHLDWDMDRYRRQDPARFVDERWKQELTTGQLRIFALWAGRKNRQYGYPPATQR